MTQPIDFTTLREASEELMSAACRDRGPQNLELTHLLNNSSTSTHVGGGTRDYYVDQTSSNSPWMSQVESVDCRTVPRAIRDLYTQVECDMFMGLFPEINRAWISIDNRLFLWNYYKGEDFYIYDGLDQLIVSVGLVRPKPGVFSEDVQYLLLISTPVEIVMLQLKFIGHPIFGDVELYPTEFNIPSDNTPMRVIKGTEDGRIFMAGHNGVLYEYLYEKPSVMTSMGFKRQCRKVEVSDSLSAVKWMIPSFIRNLSGDPDPLIHMEIDNQRHLLYTLSENSVVSLYHLGQDGKGALQLVHAISDVAAVAKRFAQDSRNRSFCDGITPSAFDQKIRVASMSTINRSESDRLNVILISDRGVRFYFTTTNRGRVGTTLQIAQIRGPPNPQVLKEAKNNSLGPSGGRSLPSFQQGGGFNNMMLNSVQSSSSNPLSSSSGSSSNVPVPPGPSCDQMVTTALYKGGVTILAFAPSPSQRQYTGTVREQHITSYSVDLGMRKPRNANETPGLPVLFPPLQWRLQTYHEVVDENILQGGPHLRENYFREQVPSGGNGVRDSRLNNRFSVGRIWDIQEEIVNPHLTEEEEGVHAHMLEAPKGNSTAGSSANRGNAGSSNSNAGSFNGNGKRTIVQQGGRGANAGGNAKKVVDSEPVAMTELAIQQLLPRRSFLVLTSKGLWSLTKHRPINQLYSLLQGPESSSNAAIEEFFNMYGLDEGCAMCLSIACSTAPAQSSQDSHLVVENGDLENVPSNNLWDANNSGAGNGPFSVTNGQARKDGSSSQNLQISRKAATWYQRAGYGIVGSSNIDDFQHGKRTLPSYENSAMSGGVQQGGFFSNNAAPSFQTPSRNNGTATAGRTAPTAMLAPGQGAIYHSGCYTGLSLNLARHFRPFWDWTVTVGAYAADSPAGVGGAPNENPSQPRCRWSRAQIDQLVQPLQRLRTFMQQQLPFRDLIQSHIAGEQQHIGTGRGAPQQRSRVGMPRTNPLTTENEKVVKLYQLLDRAIQALLLFDVLASDGQPLVRLIQRVMTPAQRGVLYRMTWGDFITTEDGLSTACLLIKGMMDTCTTTGTSSDGDVPVGVRGDLSSGARMKNLVSRLHNVCPTFFSEGDALQVIAYGELNAASLSEGAQRNAHLRAALDKLKRGFEHANVPEGGVHAWQSSLALQRLRESTLVFRRMGDFTGAVSLALHCAVCYATQPVDMLPSVQSSDEQPPAVNGSTTNMLVPFSNANPANTGSGGAPGSSSRDVLSRKLRQQCYDMVFDLLAALLPDADRVLNGKTGAMGRTEEGQLIRAGGQKGDAAKFDAAKRPELGLSFEDRAREFRNALAESLESRDKLWHFTLYRWLLVNGQKHQLLEIESLYIIDFLNDPLVHSVASAPDGTYGAPGGHIHADFHLLLMADWLVKHNRFANAAALMRKLASLEVDGQHGSKVATRTNPTLGQRIEYFARALAYAKASNTIGEAHHAELAQLQDELDVASLQRSVFDALLADTKRKLSADTVLHEQQRQGGNREVVVEYALHLSDYTPNDENKHRQAAIDNPGTLWWNLVHPSMLYNDYAFPYGLWEKCIEIMKVCDYNDPQELQNLVRNIIVEAVSRIEDWTDNRWTSVLSDYVVNLGRSFYAPSNGVDKNFVFPVGFLVEELEDDYMIIQRRILDDEYDRVAASSVARGADASSILQQALSASNLTWDPWVVNALRQFKVEFAEIYGAYCQYLGKVESGTASMNGGMGPNAEVYDERSKLYSATAICRVIEMWLSYVRSHNATQEDKEDFDLRIQHSTTRNGNEIALRDCLDKLSVMVGGLHGANLLEDERTAVGNKIQSVAEDLQRFRL